MDVAKYGFFAAHPGFEPSNVRGEASNVNFRSLELSLWTTPRNAGPLAEAQEVELRLDLLGRLDADALRELPRTGVDLALARAPLTRERLRAFERVSDFVVASAALELRRPHSPAEFQRLVARHGLLELDPEPIAVFLEDREAPLRRDGFPTERVTWPTPALAQFQAWAKKLRESDDAVLERLGLPSARELLELAAEPYAHGFAYDSATPRQLRALSSDPAVRAVAVGDVSFDLGGEG